MCRTILIHSSFYELNLMLLAAVPKYCRSYPQHKQGAAGLMYPNNGNRRVTHSFTQTRESRKGTPSSVSGCERSKRSSVHCLCSLLYIKGIKIHSFHFDESNLNVIVNIYIYI